MDSDEPWIASPLDPSVSSVPQYCDDSRMIQDPDSYVNVGDPHSGPTLVQQALF